MEAQDFEMPSPKRQRTNSPSEDKPAPITSQPLTIEAEPTVDNVQQEAVSGDNAIDDELPQTAEAKTEVLLPEVAASQEPSDMLDVLMQHVEAESAPSAMQDTQSVVKNGAHSMTVVGSELRPDQEQEQQDSEMGGVVITEAAAAGAVEAPITNEHSNDMVATKTVKSTESEHEPPPGLEAARPSTLDHLQDAAQVNGLPPTADTLAEAEIPQAATENGPEGAEPREWETDSSPYDSSDSSDTVSSSDESSSDDDDDDADEYTLLDPYEQARILMAEDGGGGGAGGAGGDDSDDEEGARPKPKTGGSGPRTVNEKPEAIMPKPNIQITDDTVIEELGQIEGIVENTALIKAKVSGEYQVLQEGSVLCLGPPARTVIGAVADTLGQVLQPLYTVRFAGNQDVVETFGLSTEESSDSTQAQIKGTKIFYVKEHSTFVFTQPLKAVKGSDASNFHDEEVGDDEMEFSDDEAEAEHKRRMKLMRRGLDPNAQPSRGRGGTRGQRGGRGRGGGGGAGMYNTSESDDPNAFGMSNGNISMNYDDVEEGETSADYTPLRRPETIPYSSLNGQTSPPQNSYQTPTRGSYNQTRGGRGGRGNNGSNYNSNRGRGNNRGNYHSNRGGNFNASNNFNNSNNNYSPTSASSMYAQQPFYPSQSQQQPQQQPQSFFGFPPPPPPPQLTPASGPYVNGGAGTIPPSPMTPLPGSNFNFQVQGQWAQYHQNQANQYAVQQAQYGQGGNAEALAQVQRQLEELRRQTQGQ